MIFLFVSMMFNDILFQVKQKGPERKSEPLKKNCVSNIKKQ